MAIIKKFDLLEPDASKAFDPIIKAYEDLNRANEKLLSGAKALQVEYTKIAKTNDGSEAKQLVEINEKLIRSNQDLIKVENEKAKLSITLDKAEQARTKTIKDKLALEQKQRSEIEKTNRAAEKQRIETENLNNAFTKQKKALNEKIKTWQDLAAQHKSNTKEAKALLSQIKNLDAEIKRIDASVGRHQRKVGEYGLALKNLGSQLLGAFGVVSGVQMFASALMGAFNTIKEFGTKVSELSAITGAAGKDLDYLKERAIDLGPKYGKSASEIVEAMKLVGSAKPELLGNVEALSQMTEAVLTLSLASGVDLAQTTSNLSIIMNQFGMSSTEAIIAIDTLAAGSKYGSVEVAYLSQAMTKVGTVAKSTGLSLGNTVAVLELFGEKGIQAEIAGTGFKSILTTLQRDSKNLTNGIFDLNKAIDNNMSISNDNIALQDKFGKEYFNLAGILLQNKNRFLELNEQVKETGIAFEQAKIATNNLAGDLDKAGSAWDSFVLSIDSGDGILSKVVRTITQLWTQALALLGVFNDLSKKGWTGVITEKIKESDEYQAKLNKRWAELLKIAKDSSTVEEGLNKIQAEKVKMGAKIFYLEKVVREEHELGKKISSIRIAQIKAEIDYYKDLSGKITTYTTDIKKSIVANVDENSTTEKTEESFKELKKSLKAAKDEYKDLLAAKKGNTDRAKELKETIFKLQKQYNEINGTIKGTKRSTDELTEAERKEIEAINEEIRVRTLQQQLREEMGIAPKTIEGITSPGAGYKTIEGKKAETKEYETIKATEKDIEKTQAIDPAIKAAQDLTKMIEKVNKARRDEELKKEKELIDKKKEYGMIALDELNNFANEMASQQVSMNLSKKQAEIEAEKELLKNKLDKGLITEQEYKTKIAELDKKSKTEEAKAQKKAALYEIAINTAVAFTKALASTGSFIKALAVAAEGAIKAAFVAATPIPKYAKGEIGIRGKRHSEGGIPIEIEDGESVINRAGTMSAPETLRMINDGLIKDSDVFKAKQNNIVAKHLYKLNKTNEQMLSVLLNGVSQYEIGDIKYIQFWDGSRLIKSMVRNG